VANSGVQRELAAGEFNKRVQQCKQAFEALQPYQPGATCLRDIEQELFERHRGRLQPVLARRAMHVVSEVKRTFSARAALLAGDYSALGASMTKTHQSLRDDFEVSSPELDLLVDAATEAEGCFGSRLTGAGFGGCTVLLVDPAHVPQVVQHVQTRYSAEKGWVPAVEVFHGDQGPREWSGAVEA
ncbi:MAG TPA: galactokinase, partial [Planctomycetota bacterium]|nr:galactokinase [Planctomycetota bacterium]